MQRQNVSSYNVPPKAIEEISFFVSTKKTFLDKICVFLLLYLPGRGCSRTESSGHPCPQSTCGRTIRGWHQPPPKQLIS